MAILTLASCRPDFANGNGAASVLARGPRPATVCGVDHGGAVAGAVAYCRSATSDDGASPARAPAVLEAAPASTSGTFGSPTGSGVSAGA